MAKFINPSGGFPICDAVVYGGKVLETVVVGIREGEEWPVVGGAGAEMREIFRQLDEVLGWMKVGREKVVSVRLYLAEVNRDIGEVNEVYKEYFAGCSPMRMAVGVVLQKRMLVEAQFIVEIE